MQNQFNKIMDIGEQMLICGAEVHRVEDSMQRMCSAIGFTRTDVFIITSSMVVTVYTENENFTQTRRIQSTGTNLEKLHRLNSLSRKICERTIGESELDAEIKHINATKQPPLWIKCLSYFVIAGAFAVFFGGGIVDFACAAIIGLLLCLLTELLEKAMPNKFFIKFTGSFLITLGAYAFMRLGVTNSMDKVIIGNIMLLIPGVGVINSLRDLLVGDSIAGLLRLIEALLLAFSIAAGYFLFVFLMGGRII
ncbi:MAG: threonine/serine exporter family protein [Clostridia bacterium]|nr:threonine/serine exporter family protein [Clostridia bacterium]